MKRSRGPDKPGKVRKKKAKKAGRPSLPEGEVKKRRTVRVSDADMNLVEEHGFTIQSLLDQAVGSLRPLDVKDLKLKLSTLKTAFSPKGI